MKILVISDSHGQLDGVKNIMERHGSFDLVIHLGDIIRQDEQLKMICRCPVKIVQGNCDFRSENPLTDIVEFDGNRALISHGHYYSVDWGTNQLWYAAEGNNCNFAMYGHTHVPEITEVEGITILNPGSISRPRQANRRKSYIIIKTTGKKADADIYYL